MVRKQKIYDQIKERIITNKLKAGQQLYEKEFMQEYSIGRTPLRDIFHDLQREGFIEIIPNLGTRVASMYLQALKETVQLRKTLEGLATELATRNITNKELELFRSLLDESKTLKNTDDEKYLIRLNEIDMEIHEIIYKMSGNQQLRKIVRGLADKMMMYWFQVGFSSMEFHQQFDELEAVYEAMLKKDSVKSKQAMQDHIQHFTKLITQNMF